MTFIGLARELAGNLGNQAAARLLLAPHHAGTFLQNNTFGKKPLAETLKNTGKKIGDTNFNERAYGAFGEIGDRLHIPDIAHKVAKSIEGNLAPQSLVIDNAIQAIDQWSHPIGQVLGIAQNLF
jgi:hypothetical protein